MKRIMKSLLTATVLTVMVLAMGVIVSAAEATATVPTKYYGNEKEFTKSYTYTNNSVLSETERGLIIPLKVNAVGTIKLNVKFTTLQKSLSAEVYTDAACTNRIGYYGIYAYSGDVSEEQYIPVSNVGTYYLRVYSSYYDDSTFTNTISLSVSEYTNTDKTIKSGQTISYYRNSSSDNYDFRYKAEKTGKVTIMLPKEYGHYVTLLNSKKKALSSKEYTSQVIGNYQLSFAVKKGTVYYFRVNAISSGEIQTITVKNTAIKAKGGSKKKKAANIKYNKTVKGLILPGVKTAKWYKFTLKKGKKPAFVLNGDVKGSLNITVYNKKGKKISSNTWSSGKATYTSYGDWTKGTYYIKISRANSISSGSFTIKNKQVKK